MRGSRKRPWSRLTRTQKRDIRNGRVGEGRWLAPNPEVALSGGPAGDLDVPELVDDVEAYDDRRLVVSLVPNTARATRQMSAQMQCKVTETIRRSLSLMRVWLSLKPGEALLVRRADGELERLVLWPEEA